MNIKIWWYVFPIQVLKWIARPVRLHTVQLNANLMPTSKTQASLYTMLLCVHASVPAKT